ncbi:fibronectin type III domain-containing protein [Marinobacter sp.]|uniref:fibronectin type III domain-containing protein n=1 Tax=Marinobacter sp. TaxID=50741 RepID=UPI003565AAC0
MPSKPHSFFRALPSLALILTALILAGCQEDTRVSKMDAQRASQVADSRLKQAQSNLLTTFGGSTSANTEQTATNNVPETQASANKAAADQPFAGSQTGKTIAPKTLAWSAPLTREDGSSLAPGQIAEYRIYYRLKHQESYDVIVLKEASTTKYPLKDMPPGAYEFAITTVDVEGLESRRSEPVEINLI